MDNNTKINLRSYCIDWLGSDASRTQADLSRKTGVDKAYISQIVGEKWTDTVPSLKQWNKLAIFFRVGNHIDSSNYLSITGACSVAQQENRVVSIDGYTGAGKSYALKRYMKSGNHVYLVQADPTMTRRAFVWELANQVGVTRLSSNLYTLLQDVISKIQSIGDPTLLIFDEIEYLPQSALSIIKTLMDKLEGHCGFVISGIYKEWLTKAANRGKPGFPQFLRRIGHSWVKMEPITRSDVSTICSGNGISDADVQSWLLKHARDYDRLTTWVRDLVEVSEANGMAISVELCSELFSD